jgi:hypothetical protein
MEAHATLSCEAWAENSAQVWGHSPAQQGRSWRLTGGPCAPCAADAVHIVLGAGGHVVVDHQLDVLHICGGKARCAGQPQRSAERGVRGHTAGRAVSNPGDWDGGAVASGAGAEGWGSSVARTAAQEQPAALGTLALACVHARHAGRRSAEAGGWQVGGLGARAAAAAGCRRWAHGARAAPPCIHRRRSLPQRQRGSCAAVSLGTATHGWLALRSSRQGMQREERHAASAGCRRVPTRAAFCLPLEKLVDGGGGWVAVQARRCPAHQRSGAAAGRRQPGRSRAAAGGRSRCSQTLKSNASRSPATPPAAGPRRQQLLPQGSAAACPDLPTTAWRARSRPGSTLAQGRRTAAAACTAGCRRGAGTSEHRMQGRRACSLAPGGGHAAPDLPRPRAATSVAIMMGCLPALNSASTQSRSCCDLSPWMESAGQPSMRSWRVTASHPFLVSQKMRMRRPSISCGAAAGREATRHEAGQLACTCRPPRQPRPHSRRRAPQPQPTFSRMRTSLGYFSCSPGKSKIWVMRWLALRSGEPMSTW